MNIEKKVAELVVQAAPLRLLADDDTDKAPLNGIIMQINELRALQANGQTEIDELEVPAKHKRGRFARVEGENA